MASSLLKYGSGIILLFMATLLPAQNTYFQSYHADMKITAYRNGNPFEWENKNIQVTVNYQTGEMIVKLKNIDFHDTGHSEFFVSDTIPDETEYTLKGFLPVREIINQKNIEQHYKVEMQLINDEMLLRQTLMFDLTVTVPNPSKEASYRLFLMEGKMYNHLVNLPAFSRFDDEINLRITFSGFIVSK